MVKATDKERVEITSIEMIMPDEVEVVIDLGDDKEHFLTMRSISYARWEALSAEIPRPQAPQLGVDANKRPLYDVNNPDYQDQLSDWQQQVIFNRLLDHVKFTVPGKDRAEQRANLMTMDRGFTGKLIEAMTLLAMGGRARVETRSRTFHGV